MEFRSNVRDFNKTIGEKTKLNDLKKSEVAELKRLVNQFFDMPIQRYYNFSSVDIWQELSKTLKKLNYTATDLVSEKKITEFFRILLDMMETERFEKLINSTSLSKYNLPKNLKEQYSKAKQKVRDATDMAKALLTCRLKPRFFYDAYENRGATRVELQDIFVNSKEIGGIGIRIRIEDGRPRVKMSLMGSVNHQREVEFDISEECYPLFTEYLKAEWSEFF